MTRRCAATRSDGQPCRNPPLAGATVCKYHGGAAPQVRNHAAIRAAVARWTDGMSTADPGETLLRLMTVALLRANQHADALDALIREHGWVDAFVGDTIVIDEDTGKARKVGEYARQLATWEASERKHAADLSVRAVAAGLAERQVRLLEQQVNVFSEALHAAVVAAGLPPEQQSEVIANVGRELRLLAG